MWYEPLTFLGWFSSIGPRLEIVRILWETYPRAHDAARIRKIANHAVIRRISFRQPEIKAKVLTRRREVFLHRTIVLLYGFFERRLRGVTAGSHLVTGLGELLGGHSDHVLESRSARGSPTTIIFGLGSRDEIARVWHCAIAPSRWTR